MEDAKVKGPMVIAMKGHKGSGKSTRALEIAKILKCPIIDLDHIRDCSAGSAEEDDDDDVDRWYQSLCSIARAQLKLELKVIVDSPLSRRSHLDRLLELSASTEAPLVVIECRPKDVHGWRHRRQQEEEEDYETGDISKLVVDTTSYVSDLELCRAIDHLAARGGSFSVNFEDWDGDGFGSVSLEEDRRGDNKEGTLISSLPYHIHNLVLSAAEEERHTTTTAHDKVGGSCEACLEPISSGRFYRCDGCSLLVHEMCAEQPYKTGLLPKDYPPSLRFLWEHQYNFPEQHLCEAHCKGILTECRRCLFETFLRHALLPSVVHHRCHEHPLYIKFHPRSFNYEYRCQACGYLGQHALYSCHVCEFECHVDCALIPNQYKDSHHRHCLTISPPNPDDDPLEYCFSCETERNPKLWTFSCPKVKTGECNGFPRHIKCPPKE